MNRFHSPYIIGITVALIIVLCDGFAQEFDTVISSRDRKAYTILDQVEDPAERRELMARFEEREAKERANLQPGWQQNSGDGCPVDFDRPSKADATRTKASKSEIGV